MFKQEKNKIFKFLVLMIVFFCFPQLSRAELNNSGLRGKILLQVESHGEAWYLDPVSEKRAYLGRPVDAFKIMRDFGLGIGELTFEKFSNEVPERFAGRILLRVEANGEAYYVNPSTLEMHFLGRPADAFEVMREQGLGISNDNLELVLVNEKYPNWGEMKQKVLDYLKNNLLADGQNAEIRDVTLEGEMYKFIVKLQNGQEVISYTNKEVTKFFPQALDIEDEKNITEDPGDNEEEAEGQVKTEIPVVELFVMSHCPYGLQIEKGIWPVVEILDNDIDFEVKFLNYAMHGLVEVREQTRQYCIQKEQRETYFNYINCFLIEGDSDSCLASSSVDMDVLNSCVDEIEEEFEITDNYNNKTGSFPKFLIHDDEVEDYGITGSPTLVINGNVVHSGRDSQTLLDLICDGFIEKPEECNTKLSSENPSPGFGFNTSGASSGANCGG